MARKLKRVLAAFNLSKLGKIGDFALKVTNLIFNVKNNPLVFVTPHPATLTMEGHMDELVHAENEAMTRTAGKVALRDVKYNVVLKDVYLLQAYVQSLADEAPDVDSAIAIIQTSGFDVRLNGVRVKAPIQARNGMLPGTMDLIAKAEGKRANYNWQMSSDMGATWQNLPDTLKAKTTVSGLTTGSILLFRVQAITKEGERGWSQPVSAVVL